MSSPVPNIHPRLTNQPYRIAIIGEAPGETEVTLGQPFVGKSGALLWSVAAKHGIVRDACLVANVCQHRPPENKLSNFAWTGPEIQSGLTQLKHDLEQFRPNLCVLLGNYALKAFTGETGISNWRGSLLQGTLDHTAYYKLLPSLHPAGILRVYKGRCLLDFDLRRARQEGTTPTLSLPQRNIVTDLSYDEILAGLDSLCTTKPTIAVDIEGYWNHITCISLAVSPQDCCVIPLDTWEEPQERSILVALARVLGDRTIPKILQNCLYDTFCLQYGYNIPVRGIVDDTMLQCWELYCELEKSLGFQASIFTREPYYKDEREHENRKTRLVYCGKDSAVTYECRNAMSKRLSGGSLTHYKFNLDVLEPLLYIELKGINYDQTKAKSKAAWCRDQSYRLQYALDSIAGILHPDRPSAWIPIIRDTLCFKKTSSAVNLVNDIVPNAKITCYTEAVRATDILTAALRDGERKLTHSEIGELATLTSTELNVESRDQIANFLYRCLNLPIQFKKEGNKLTDKETTDVLALLKLYKKTNDETLKLILRIRALRTRLEALEATADPDGRIRCGYNVVGTKTGRISCYTSPTGSGFNLQTATKKDRDLFIADPGYWFFQCDLSGADGWTVAAHCWAAGDSTMLDDYFFGLKPARIIALIYLHGQQVLTWSRDRIKSESKKIDDDGWLYFACKRVQHGSNYGMKGETMSNQILKDSYKLFGEPIAVAPKICDQLQRLYFMRYRGVPQWHAKIKNQLKSHGYLISANGHKRIFFGRLYEYDTFMEACAEEPQNNTTYSTNAAVLKLWTDPENRVNLPANPRVEQPSSITGQRRQVGLRIQPLHQVHDALCGQFRKEETAWATPKIREYFNNPLTIAGRSILIPFEGKYGESWGNLKEGNI